MAAVSPAAALRARARDALTAAGGRGFVRFAPDGALLVSDAAMRADEQTAACLLEALEKCGFSVRVSGGMLHIDPTDALIDALAADVVCAEADMEIDWSSALYPAQALAARWMRAPDAPVTDRGRALVRETLRLIWQPESRVLAGLGSLRARAAAMLRDGERGGMRQAGALLMGYCISQRGENI